MDCAKRFAALIPRRLETQMVAVLALSLLGLFAVLMILEVLAHETAIETAQSAGISERLKRLHPLLDGLGGRELNQVLQIVSTCHEGYTVSDAPFRSTTSSPETQRLQSRLAQQLSLTPESVRVGFAQLSPRDFSYSRCSHTEIDLPVQSVVISLKLSPDKWLNREVHPHEWHFREKLGWMLRASAAFAFVGAIAIFFIHRLSRPLNALTEASRQFGDEMKIQSLTEAGPADVRRAIGAFNAMQRQVADEVERRTNTLVAISHDLRTPVTALRVRAEMVDDDELREGLISSLDRMERVTASALEFLRGQSRSEPLQTVDVSALVESECVDFEETARLATFVGEHHVTCVCRPDALARAVRNLIDNAVRYGLGATVAVQPGSAFVTITVSDQGPGIPAGQWPAVLEPFVRLSQAREDHRGGFGLGLPIAKAVAEGHDGELVLEANQPSGLIVRIRLPARITSDATEHRLTRAASLQHPMPTPLE